MYCRKCGSELRNTDVFCTNCGEKIADSYKNDVENITQKRQTKFDRFMKKTFFQNKDFTNEEYEKVGKFSVAIIVLFQFIAMFLVLFFDVEIPTGGIFLFWWLLDCYILNQLGIRGKWKIWGVIVIPVYLCIRAKKTDKKYTWAIVSILVCALGIGGAFVSEFYGGTELNTSGQYISSKKVDGELNTSGQYISSKKVDEELAIQIVKDYLQDEFVGDLIGVSLEYTDVKTVKRSKGNYTASFYMRKYNKFTDSYDEPNYVELTANENGVLFGYNIESLYEYLSELGYPLEYTISSTWDRKYTILNDESLQSKNEDVSDENSSEKIANDEIVNNSEIANNEYASNETVINEEVTSDNVLISENTENESIDLNDYPLTNESNNEDFNAYGENSVVFSNGLKITVPDSWIGIYDTYETSDTYVVCDGYAGGNLLDIELITSESELDSLNKWAVLGYYYDNNVAIGLVLSYPNYENYDANGGAMASNGLYKEVDRLIYDTSGIANFAFCDEQTLRSVLSK